MKRLFLLFVSVLSVLCSYATKTAKAVVSKDKLTLTFYYDNVDHSSEGIIFDLNEVDDYPGWYRYKETITTAVFDESFKDARPASTCYWFYDSAITELKGIENLNTSEVTNMANMFDGCKALKSLDLSSFNTENVTNMRCMFLGCTSLQYLDVSNFNTGKVTSMYGLFYSCESLTSLDLSSFNTENVTDMSCMFYGCSTLKSVDLSSFNTGNVTDMSCMFYGCSTLKSVDLSSFNTANVTTMDYMFENCKGIESLDLYSFNTEKATESMMFSYCKALKTICVSDKFVVSKYTGDVFRNCLSLTGGAGTTYSETHYGSDYAIIDGGESSPGYFTGKTGKAVLSADQLTLTFYFDTKNHSSEGTVFALNDGANDPGWGVYINTITTVVFDESFKDARPTSTYRWFFATSASPLKEFKGLENLNTSETTNMSYMFYHCGALESLDLTSFNTEKVSDMSFMFGFCKALKSLDVSSFNTENVTDMSNMFSGCSALESLDLSSFNTAKVTNMNNMFYRCSALELLDLSNFNTAKVTDMSHMFYACENLKTIYLLENFATASLNNSDDMFFDCIGITGENGTRFNYLYTNITYARIDGGVSDPGYFTVGRKAKAVLSPDELTLTFYYDNVDHSSEGTCFDLNQGRQAPGWHGYTKTITTAIFDESFRDARPTTTARWFERFGSSSKDYAALTTIKGIENLNTSEVTDMYCMFYQCGLLESLDLSYFDTKNVTLMSWMFQGCKKLKTIYASDKFVTTNVALNDGMFRVCNELVGGAGTEVDPNLETYLPYAKIDGGPSDPGYFTRGKTVKVVLSADEQTLTFYNDGEDHSSEGKVFSLNTGTDYPEWSKYNKTIKTAVFDVSFKDVRPTSTYGWFYDGSASALEEVRGIEYLNTSEVKNMNGMFQNCKALKTVNLNKFNTANVTDMSNMFSGCKALKSIWALDDFVTTKLNVSDGMFAGCDNLSGEAGTLFSSAHTDGAYARIDGGTENPGYFTTGKTAKAVVAADGASMTFCYDAADHSSEGAVFDLNEGTEKPQWYDYNKTIKTVVFDKSFKEVRPLTSYWWFGYETDDQKSALTEIKGLENLNTAEMRYMCNMFYNCEALKSLDLSNFNTENVTDMSNMFNGCAALESLDLSSFNTGKVVYMTNLFGGCKSLETVDLSSFNTEKVVHMDYMFSGCESLESLDLSNFCTVSLTYMDNMFSDCAALESLDLSNFNTKYVEDMSYLFSGCRSLKSINLDNFNTENVSFIYRMFQNCESLEYVDLSSFNPKNANSLDYMFSGCKALTSVNISHFTSEVWGISCRHTFSGCELLESIDISNFNNIYTTESMFSDCKSLKHINMGNINTENLKFIGHMFSGCESLETLDISRFNNANLESVNGLFNGCKALKLIDAFYLNTDKVDDMSSMFSGCESLEFITLSGLNTENVTNMSSMFSGCSALRTVSLVGLNTSKVTDMSNMFSGCSALKTIMASDEFVTTNVTNSAEMFANTQNLTGGAGTTFSSSYTDGTYARIDKGENAPGYFSGGMTAKAVMSADKLTLTFYCDNADHSSEGTVFALNEGENSPKWHDYAKNFTSVVFDESFCCAQPTTTCKWFYEFNNLKEIKGIEYLNTSKVTIMSSMFQGCSSLPSLDVSHFITNNATKINNMFMGCSSLEYLNLGNFNTQNVTVMNCLFWNCKSLRLADLSSFNTEKVTDLGRMFQGCTSLKFVNLGSFNTTITFPRMDYMFQYCRNLKTIYASENFVRSSQTDDMFDECYSIVGGEGTTWISDSYNYAIIDGKVYPGYYTSIDDYPKLTIRESGYTTFSSATMDLDFTKVKDYKAYAVVGYRRKDNTAIIAEVGSAKAGTGLLIIGKPGTYDLDLSYSPNACYGFMKGVENETMLAQTDGANTNFVLDNDSEGIAFYEVNNYNCDMFASSAYLSMPTSAVAGAKVVRLAFEGEDETTDISDIISAINAENSAGTAVYNLAGQKVNSNYKGIVIKNGKKMMIK